MKAIFKTIAAIRTIAACGPLIASSDTPAGIPEVAEAYRQMGALLERQCAAAGVSELLAIMQYDNLLKDKS